MISILFNFTKKLENQKKANNINSNPVKNWKSKIIEKNI